MQEILVRPHFRMRLNLQSNRELWPAPSSSHTKLVPASDTPVGNDSPQLKEFTSAPSSFWTTVMPSLIRCTEHLFLIPNYACE